MAVITHSFSTRVLSNGGWQGAPPLFNPLGWRFKRSVCWYDIDFGLFFTQSYFWSNFPAKYVGRVFPKHKNLCFDGPLHTVSRNELEKCHFRAVEIWFAARRNTRFPKFDGSQCWSWNWNQGEKKYEIKLKQIQFNVSPNLMVWVSHHYQILHKPLDTSSRPL